MTGAASGIGRAIAHQFAALGSVVTLADIDEEGLARACQEITGTTYPVLLDVRDERSVVRCVAAATQNGGGRLDVAVNSHGILTQSLVNQMTLEQWQGVIDIDLTGVFLLLREEARVMAPQGEGRIITIASQLAIKGGVEVAHYSAAKAGVIALSKSAALELAPRGVLVNCIAPGPIVTPLTDGMTEEWKQAKSQELPIGRFGDPEEVAVSALLLASSPSGNLYAGQTLHPNAGDVMP
ncbi:SDR family NAD(P)-dependent oxidoreductase [Raineyella sp. W15-4]|uniref:SDR family NAD(P)-dependent oxidoreductase n=1 Tax=Raineyella sp. W15-4 TaxID=3081651 RepID=UPI002955BE6B|nr:SDR family NAD(P)-dependent oxidoreductase [Raineyella sp. W15-4]WOQ16474.1 SDR family NAD(P)-dependent oxidoreductase [Raineyella sp. W15-4]